MKKMKKIKSLMALVINFVLIGAIGTLTYGATDSIAELDLLNLIPAELLIIAVVVYCIAEFIKRTGKAPNWTIPVIVLILAILITIIYTAVVLEQGLTSKTIVNGIVYGVLIASVAVYSNQLVKQIFVKRLE